MVGANYMGGKRNAAKARAKDSTARAQKRYFGAQRLNLAANRGRSGADDPETAVSNLPKTNGPTKVSDIQLAHARQNFSNIDTQINGYIPAPIRISPCTPKSKIRLSKLSEDSSSSGPRRIRSSKVLQALDTSEPSALRVAMDKVLSLPDLAGLSRRPSRDLKRKRSSSPCPGSHEDHKRRKTGSMSENQLLTPSDNSLFSTTTDIDLSRQESSDLEVGIIEPHLNLNTPECNDEVIERHGQGYSSDTNNSATWTVYHNRKTDSPGISHHTHSSNSSSRHAPRNHSNVVISPQYRANSDYSIIHPRTSNLSSPQTPRSNIFDYEDPWMAIGVMLGIEKTPQSPLKKHDFQKILAEIPTPATTPITANLNAFGRNANQVISIVKEPTLQDYSLRPASPFQSPSLKPPVYSQKFNAIMNVSQDSFQIFSPPTRTQTANILHPLVPYSSEVSSPIRDQHFSNFYSVPSSEAERSGSVNGCRMVADGKPAPTSFGFSSVILRIDSGEVESDNFTLRHGSRELPSSFNGNEMDDANFNNLHTPKRRQLAETSSSLKLFDCSPQFSSSHTQHQPNYQQHEPTSMSNLDQFPDDDEHSSQFQGVSVSEGAESLSSFSPMQFAPPPDGCSDPNYRVFSLSGAVQDDNEYLRTPQRRTRTDVYTPHNDKIASSQVRLVIPTRVSPTKISPYCSTSQQKQFAHQPSSPSMRAFRALSPQPDQSHDQPFAPAPSTGAPLDPRAKLSTELDTSLHRAIARFRSPAPRPTSSTRNSLRTPLTRRSPFIPRSNSIRAAPVSRSAFPTFVSNTCSGSSSESPAGPLVRNHANEDLTSDCQSQDARQSRAEGSQQNNTEAVWSVAPAYSTDHTSNVDEKPIPPLENGVRNKELASRAASCFSLFANDEVVSDSDD